MCGIGGRTIEEAQLRMSYPEFLRWAQYRRKRGTLNMGMRVERGAALVSALYANSKRKQGAPSFHIHDFAPHEDRPELTLAELENWG